MSVFRVIRHMEKLQSPPSFGPMSQGILRRFCVDSLHPMKAATDEFELVAVKKMELHVKVVLVDVAIQNQLIRGRTFESEVSIPVFAAGTGVGER
jgi:hypothetical protein